MRDEILKDNCCYKIQKARQEHIAFIKELCDETLGKDFYNTNEISDTLGREDDFFYILTTEDGEIIGFHYHFIRTLREAAASFHCNPEAMAEICGCNTEQRVGVLKSIGITARYRGKGLAYTFNRYAIENLFEMGIPSIWVPAWMQKGYIPENNTLIRQGFHPFTSVEKLWYDKDLLKCPACGNGRCICNAMIYYSTENVFAKNVVK